MRIIINASFLSEWVGGLANYSLTVIDHLCQCGEGVTVYAPDCVKLNGQAAARRRATPAMLRSSAGRIGSALRAMAWCQTVLPLQVLRDRADVLFSTVPEGMLMPVCPQVVVVHDLMPLFYPEEYPRWQHYFRHVLPRLLKSCQRVIADSGHTRRDLIRELRVPEEKIEVIYPWVDPLFFSDDPGSVPEGHKPGTYFLFIGPSLPRKNLETVIRALARIRGEVSHSLVCVLGLGRERVFIATSLVCLAFNATANLVFIPHFSWRAAAVATVATEIVLLAQNCYWMHRSVGTVPVPKFKWGIPA